MAGTYHLLMICGSLRAGSTNAALLRTAQAVAPDGLVADVYGGMGGLPQFNPDDDREPALPAVADLRTRISAADAVVFCTPEYAGGLPGSLKNLLDWTVGSGELYRKHAAWINVSTTTGAVHAHASLRTVLGYVGADLIEQACTHRPVPRHAIGPDGMIRDPEIRADVLDVLNVLARRLDGTDKPTGVRDPLDPPDSGPSPNGP
ncbi:NADPH-dependent FMN reductase [Frankia sp. Cas3]|uniref:NADPH-dependent FMN reductase n=1 Tax=Frankia sp. Cas3 TaxID=3073926 RepID=UPI002AD416FF|nr:NADPH-dependent FMN reductase [Frankia sp. Cas3]